MWLKAVTDFIIVNVGRPNGVQPVYLEPHATKATRRNFGIIDIVLIRILIVNQGRPKAPRRRKMCHGNPRGTK